MDNFQCGNINNEIDDIIQQNFNVLNTFCVLHDVGVCFPLGTSDFCIF